jgi:hypothetical protein
MAPNLAHHRIDLPPYQDVPHVRYLSSRTLNTICRERANVEKDKGRLNFAFAYPHESTWLQDNLAGAGDFLFSKQRHKMSSRLVALK